MNLPEPLLDLAQRYVDDQQSLTEEEWLRLVEAGRTEPEFLSLLRMQLQYDDRLSRVLAGDRQHFMLQVEQRVADYLRGEDELTRQATELRSLALERYQSLGKSPAAQHSSWWAWGLTLSLVLFVALGSGAWMYRETNAVAVYVHDVQGNVVVRRQQADDQSAATNLPLRGGDRLLVQHDAQITLRYHDGTQVRLAGETVLDLPAAKFQGKQLYLDKGELTAQVAPQPASKPMIFSTPHAEAIVRGTELRLVVRERETQLDVTEGKVELADRKTHDSQLVLAAESAVAVYGEKVAKQGVSFPSQRQGLLYLFAGRNQPVLAKQGRELRSTELLAANNEARYTSMGNMELSGGWFHDSHASALLQSIYNARQYTFELILSPDAIHHEQPQVIMALGSVERPQIALLQRGEKLYLVHDAGTRMAEEWFTTAPQAVELGKISDAEATVHLLVSYQQDQVLIAQEGVVLGALPLKKDYSIATDGTQLFFGSLPQRDLTPWKGRIAGFALYDRALNATEIKRSGVK
jgi:hypothetical protein